MDKEFSRLFWEREGFPQEARQALDLCLDRLDRLGKTEALDGIGAFYRGNGFDADLTQPLLEDLALETEISVYTLWLLLLIDQAKTAFGDYKALGVPEQVVWDTFQDLTYKLLECKQVYGVWGTFVASWYHIFFTCDIVKLGRLEFESTVYDEAVPYRFGDFTLEKGDPVKSIHIPSSGEPFTWEARLDSYKRAYRFFQKELNGGPWCACAAPGCCTRPTGRSCLPSPTSSPSRGTLTWPAPRRKPSSTTPGGCSGRRTRPRPSCCRSAPPCSGPLRAG